MSPQPDLLETLTALTTSLTTTSTSLQSSEFPTLTAPENGISLLDLKNELLLSYIHNVVFLVLVRLRSGTLSNGVGADAVKELVKIRVLLERGVKPLEGKLKYQIDKVIAAAAAPVDAVSTAKEIEVKNGGGGGSDSSDEEDRIDHDDYGDYSHRQKLQPEATAPVSTLARKELAFRPNPAALSKPSAPSLSTSTSTASSKDGIYRPPRISATSMPDTHKPSEKEKPLRRKSHMLDEFVADELSTAPSAEPSIGSTIIDSGRVVKSARDRREERERQEYEENNFVRLPKMSKKEASELKRRGGREANGLSGGGEDWSSFTGDIERLTKGVDGASKSAKLLERSRKRRGDGDGGDEDAGGSRVVGESFERRKERFAKRRKT
ncbi:hypothetical protein L873DRAFT_1828734 [Choiromyces venosus 120613-1]|uniref:Localizes primarily to the nucleolus n=1 Tax=Choiromyces venosus 120613-1 TaxID=1336337 RepID=A0A3N4JM50_9PEZI|nr:hypothetical protein L873DRAFT_1828734 [Choiromyces venosus 120613-1]